MISTPLKLKQAAQAVRMIEERYQIHSYI